VVRPAHHHSTLLAMSKQKTRILFWSFARRMVAGPVGHEFLIRFAHKNSRPHLASLTSSGWLRFANPDESKAVCSLPPSDKQKDRVFTRSFCFLLRGQDLHLGPEVMSLVRYYFSTPLLCWLFQRKVIIQFKT
jgi:hypothetical protein